MWWSCRDLRRECYRKRVYVGNDPQVADLLPVVDYLQGFSGRLELRHSLLSIGPNGEVVMNVSFLYAYFMQGDE